MKNRKVILYIIGVVAIVLLSFFGKEGATAIVTLTGLYFGANCAQKSNICSEYNKRLKEEE